VEHSKGASMIFWLGLILGTIGATWYTLGQKRLQDASMFTCLQLVIIIALIISGMAMVTIGIAERLQ
jgi:hypothetical protein